MKLPEPVGLVDRSDLGVVRGLPGTPFLLGGAGPPDRHHPGCGRKRNQWCRGVSQERLNLEDSGTYQARAERGLFTN